jgi:hypothetical protein
LVDWIRLRRRQVANSLQRLAALRVETYIVEHLDARVLS